MEEELLKATQTNAEPVAWQSTLQKNWEISHKEFLAGDYDKRYWLPLYTTPHHASDVKQTKPLSDEEIIELWQKSHVNGALEFEIVSIFARAIEERILGK